MLQQFHNMSTWRKQTVTIKPHETETLDFLDTNPNMFYIINPNLAGLKVGIGSMPRSNSYEFKVEANSSEILGRPEGSTKLYILNDSGIEITITVFSVNKEFDPSILKNMNVVMEGLNLEAGSEITGIVDGLILPTQEKNSSEIKSNIAQILTLLNATGVKEYNSTEILNELKKLMSENTTLNTLVTKLNAIIENTGKDIVLNAENVEAIAYDDTQLLEKLELIYNWNKMQYFSCNPTQYENNATSFTYEATGFTHLIFKWLFNDGGLANIKIDNEIILTMFPGERLTDLHLYLLSGQTVTIESEKPMYRIGYTTMLDPTVH